uniref:Uncharacterized protein n=1 Tax=Solanum tuberosum TaxID=4113 RepID=M1BQ45_SOLTU
MIGQKKHLELRIIKKCNEFQSAWLTQEVKLLPSLEKIRILRGRIFKYLWSTEFAERGKTPDSHEHLSLKTKVYVDESRKFMLKIGVASL